MTATGVFRPRVPPDSVWCLTNGKFCRIAGTRSNRGVDVCQMSGSENDAGTGEGVNSSGSSDNFAAVIDTAGDEILLSSPQWNALASDDQGIAALSDDHVLVVVVNMRC